ncbi:sigma-70 family RNA polymerase sigma factor [Amycolatopsis sp., V23-08]|uniref:RNA polymerase sigma factor n=1 Tax=Amycolatopsis heterodermiae TaxID=3110235 RepID=A0ABU5R348_9PSEU|nr:sigma-70 family RNA polymerase sigma factor [Amycolatopsis sp., V23-08]MEA5360588.1 sigma-70 family RNA polymerase sigma factor [Amycolatopsis sp., V23-08]
MIGQKRLAQADVAQVTAARAGDRAALDALVAAYLPLVYSIAGRALTSDADVDDVVQETMLRVLRGIENLREPSRFRSWLVAVTINQIREHHRRRSAAPAPLAEYDERPDPDAEFTDIALARLHIAEQRREVDEAARWLDPADRELLALWTLERAGHLTRTEVAEALRLDAHLVTVRVSRLKTRLEAVRPLVRALAAEPGCAALIGASEGWSGRPSALWRKRFLRHVEDCERCRHETDDAVPVERILTGAALLVLPFGYLPQLLANLGDLVSGPAGSGALGAAGGASGGAAASGAAGTGAAGSGVATGAGMAAGAGGAGSAAAGGGVAAGAGSGAAVAASPAAVAGAGVLAAGGAVAAGSLARLLASKPFLAAAGAAIVSVLGVAGVVGLAQPDQPIQPPAALAGGTSQVAPKPVTEPVTTPTTPPVASTETTPTTEAQSTAPQPKAPDPTSTPPHVATPAERVLAMINDQRAAAGLPPLRMDPALVTSAAAHNRAMADNCGLSHQCPGEAPFGDREHAAGAQWSSAGENVGTGGPVADATDPIARMALGLTQSMHDEKPPDDGHRRNILSTSFTRVGISVTRDARGSVWLTQDFAG